MVRYPTVFLTNVCTLPCSIDPVTRSNYCPRRLPQQHALQPDLQARQADRHIRPGKPDPRQNLHTILRRPLVPGRGLVPGQHMLATQLSRLEKPRAPHTIMVLGLPGLSRPVPCSRRDRCQPPFTRPTRLRGTRCHFRLAFSGRGSPRRPFAAPQAAIPPIREHMGRVR